MTGAALRQGDEAASEVENWRATPIRPRGFARSRIPPWITTARLSRRTTHVRDTFDEQTVLGRFRLGGGWPERIGQLYGYRWLAELDARAVKITMGLDVLRCQTPVMVRREIGTGLLAYNVIRRPMLQSAQKSGRTPRQLSFSAAMQAIAPTWQVIVLSNDAIAARLVEIELKNLAAHGVADRPGRVEPRAVKRRPKPHDLVTKPRSQARAELLWAAQSYAPIKQAALPFQS